LNFVACILFIDEAAFTRNGITNFHNDRSRNSSCTYSSKSSKLVFVKCLNVISPHQLICNFPKSVIKCYLSQFFGEYITFLESMPLVEKLSSTCMMGLQLILWVKEHLNTMFDQRWIGHGSIVSCIALSILWFKSLKLCLWGYLKRIVYSSAINDFGDKWLWRITWSNLACLSNNFTKT